MTTMVEPAADSAAKTTEHVLVLKRTFDAPRPILFRAWTQPESLVHWFGPQGCTLVSHSFDVRPGGAYRCCLRSADGTDHWLRGTYREILAPERLVFTHGWEAEDGSVANDTLVTVTFAEAAGRTQLTLHQAFFDTVDGRDSHGEGWTEALDRLIEHLSGD